MSGFFRRRRWSSRILSRLLNKSLPARPRRRRALAADLLEERCVLTTEELINLTQNTSAAVSYEWNSVFLGNDDRFAAYVERTGNDYSLIRHDVDTGNRTVVDTQSQVTFGNPFHRVAAVSSDGGLVVLNPGLYDFGGVYNLFAPDTHFVPFSPILRRTDPNNIEHFVNLFTDNGGVASYLGVSGDGRYAFFASNMASNYQFVSHDDGQGHVSYTFEPTTNTDRRFAVWRMSTADDNYQQAESLQRWSDYGLFDSYANPNSGPSYLVNIRNAGIGDNGAQILFASTDDNGTPLGYYLAAGGSQSLVSLPNTAKLNSVQLNHAGTAYAYQTDTNDNGTQVFQNWVAGFGGGATQVGAASGASFGIGTLSFSGDDQRLYYERFPNAGSEDYWYTVNTDGTGERLAFAHNAYAAELGVLGNRYYAFAADVDGAANYRNVYLLRDIPKTVDAVVRADDETDANFALNDVYEIVPSLAQTEWLELAGNGATRSAFLRIQNDGSTATQFRVLPQTSAGLSGLPSGVTVRKNGVDVTSQFTAGYVTDLLAPGAFETLEIVVGEQAVTYVANERELTFRVYTGLETPVGDAVKIVAAKPVKPDLLIRKHPGPAAFQGDNVYQAVAPSGVQEVVQKVQPGSTVRYYVFLQNDNADFSNRYLLKVAETIPAGWTVQYKIHDPEEYVVGRFYDLSEGTDITAALRSTTGFIAPSESNYVSSDEVYPISITITRNAGTADDSPDAVTVLSVLDIYGRAVRDQVKAVARTERLDLIVNTTLDETDKNPDPNVIDVDLKTAGNQISLRAAIEYANTKPGIDVITFAIPGNGAPTIKILSALPTITEALTINGLSQSGGRVVLDGGLRNFVGIHVAAINVDIRGLTIQKFGQHGIRGTQTVRLEDVKLLENRGAGILADADVSFFGTLNEANKNHGSGIETIGGVYVDKNINVDENRGYGIRANGLLQNSELSVSINHSDPFAGNLVRSSVSKNRLSGIRTASDVSLHRITINGNGKFAEADGEGHGLYNGGGANQFDLEDAIVDGNAQFGVLAGTDVKFSGGVNTGGNSVSRNGKGGISADSVIVLYTIVVDGNGGYGVRAWGTSGIEGYEGLSVMINGDDPNLGSGNRSSVSGNRLSGIRGVGEMSLHRVTINGNGKFGKQDGEHDGIYGGSSLVWLGDAIVDGNAQFGILTGADVKFSGGQNTGDNSVSRNGKGGISANSVVVLRTIVIDANKGFGIRAWGVDNLDAEQEHDLHYSVRINDQRLFWRSDNRSIIRNNRLGGIWAVDDVALYKVDVVGNGRFGRADDEGHGLYVRAADADLLLSEAIVDGNARYGIKSGTGTEVHFIDGRAIGENSVSRNGRGGIYAGSVLVDKTINVDANRGRGIEAVDPLAIDSVKINALGSMIRSSVSRNKLSGIQAVGPVELHLTDLLNNGVG